MSWLCRSHPAMSRARSALCLLSRAGSPCLGMHLGHHQPPMPGDNGQGLLQVCGVAQMHCRDTFLGNTMTQHGPGQQGRLMFLHTNLSPKWNLNLPGSFRDYTRRWQARGPCRLHMQKGLCPGARVQGPRMSVVRPVSQQHAAWRHADVPPVASICCCLCRSRRPCSPLARLSQTWLTPRRRCTACWWLYAVRLSCLAMPRCAFPSLQLVQTTLCPPARPAPMPSGLRSDQSRPCTTLLPGLHPCAASLCSIPNRPCTTLLAGLHRYLQACPVLSPWKAQLRLAWQRAPFALAPGHNGLLRSQAGLPSPAQRPEEVCLPTLSSVQAAEQACAGAVQQRAHGQAHEHGPAPQQLPPHQRR